MRGQVTSIEGVGSEGAGSIEGAGSEGAGN